MPAKKSRAFAVSTGERTFAVTAKTHQEAALKAMRQWAEREGEIKDEGVGALVEIIGEGDSEADTTYMATSTVMKLAGLVRA